MKNKIIPKTPKWKLYHKLINNEVVYDNKSLSRYKKLNTNQSIDSK